MKDVAGERIKFGASLDNTRRRASELTAERVCGTRRAWDDDPIRDAGGGLRRAGAGLRSSGKAAPGIGCPGPVRTGTPISIVTPAM